MTREFVIAYVIWFAVGGLWSSIFMLARNSWLHNKIMKHLTLVYGRSKDMIERGQFDPVKIDRMYECYEDYSIMMRRFWIWDMTRFIKDPIAYRWIYGSSDDSH